MPEANRPSWREWGAALITMKPESVAAAVRDMVAHVQDLIAWRAPRPGR